MEDNHMNSETTPEPHPEGHAEDPKPAFNNFKDAVKHGADDARAKAQEAAPKIKGAIAEAAFDLAYSVAYGTVFAGAFANEFVPQSVKEGLKKGAEAGRRASEKAREKAKHKPSEVEENFASPGIPELPDSSMA